jgi:hypothetical protein
MNIIQKISRYDLRRQLDSRQMENRRITFSDLVKLYCLAKPPNKPRDARLKKWLGTLTFRRSTTGRSRTAGVPVARWGL